MNFLLERPQHVWLVKVIRSRNNHGVELIGIEELVDICEDVRYSKSLRERLRLRTIIVADRDKLRTTNARKHRKVRELCYRSRANKTKPDIRAQMCPTVVPW